MHSCLNVAKLSRQDCAKNVPRNAFTRSSAQQPMVPGRPASTNALQSIGLPFGESTTTRGRGAQRS